MPQTHAVLAKGYDDAEEKLYVDDPNGTASAFFAYSRLDAHWTAWIPFYLPKTRNAGIIIYPKDSQGGTHDREDA